MAVGEWVSPPDINGYHRTKPTASGDPLSLPLAPLDNTVGWIGWNLDTHGAYTLMMS